MDSTNTDNMIKINEEGMFECKECENVSKPQTSTVDGLVDADIDAIKAELEEFPTKIVYGVCPICGMEHVFRLIDGVLYLEQSEEEK